MLQIVKLSGTYVCMKTVAKETDHHLNPETEKKNQYVINTAINFQNLLSAKNGYEKMVFENKDDDLLTSAGRINYVHERHLSRNNFQMVEVFQFFHSFFFLLTLQLIKKYVRRRWEKFIEKRIGEGIYNFAAP